jgi:hypothetical protein
VHEVAREVGPGVRVAYVDYDRLKSGGAHARWAGQAAWTFWLTSLPSRSAACAVAVQRSVLRLRRGHRSAAAPTARRPAAPAASRPRPLHSVQPCQQRLVRQHCQTLASQGIEPQATWIRDGYLDTIRARINWTESLQIP